MELQSAREFRVAVARGLSRESSRDLVQILLAFIASASTKDTDLGLCVNWSSVNSGVTLRVTPFQQLFSFVMERRLSCRVCGARSVLFELSNLLRLPVPDSDKGHQSFDRMYLAFRGERVETADVFCSSCMCERIHVEQRRMQCLPNMLLVHVSRQRPGTDAIVPFSYRVDSALSLPGLGSMDLISVVYRVGAGGPWSCACRELTNSYWYFKDALKPTLLPDVANVFGKYVVLLMYVKTDFAARYGQISSVSRVDAASAGTGHVGKQTRRGMHSDIGLDAPGDQEMDGVRSYFEGLGIGGGCTERLVVPTKAGFMAEASVEARGKVAEMSCYAWRLWSDGATFLDVLFGGGDGARAIVSDISERTAGGAEVSANERGFLYLAEQCKAMALTKRDFLEYRAWRHQERACVSSESGMQEPMPADRCAKLKELAVHASRLWREDKTFLRLLYDDAVVSDELLDTLLLKESTGEVLDHNERDFVYFANECMSWALTHEEFDEFQRSQRQVVEQAQLANEKLERERNASAGAMQRHRAVLAQEASVAATRRRSQKAKAGLFESRQSSMVGKKEIEISGRPAGLPRVEKEVPVPATLVSACRRDSLLKRKGSSSRMASAGRTIHGIDRMPNTRLFRRLADAFLDVDDVVIPLLAELQQMYGQGLAWEFAESAWLNEWSRWDSFEEEILIAHGRWVDGLLLPHVSFIVKELLFALRRHVQEHRHAMRPQMTDQGKLEELKACGFVWSHGNVWLTNNCLADSILQLLIGYGIVAHDIDRRAACLANRAALEAQPDLVPRQRNGARDLGGYLQHHRHAAPTIRFFKQMLRCADDVLPAAGFRVFCHASYDDADHPPDEDLVCEGIGTRP
jgi:hypothetical protein